MHVAVRGGSSCWPSFSALPGQQGMSHCFLDAACARLAGP